MTSTQLLLHPWVCKDVDPVQLLQLNKRYVVASMADAPQPELLAEVRAVLREAQGDRAPESPESPSPYAVSHAFPHARGAAPPVSPPSAASSSQPLSAVARAGLTACVASAPRALSVHEGPGGGGGRAASVAALDPTALHLCPRRLQPCTPSEPSAGSGALPVSGTQSSADSRLAPAGLMSSCANNDLAAMAD